MQPDSHSPAEAPRQPAPVMDVVSRQPAQPPKNYAAPPPAYKPPKQPNRQVGWAIFATVVIVLGLGAMAMYAYLRTQ